MFKQILFVWSQTGSIITVYGGGHVLSTAEGSQHDFLILSHGETFHWTWLTSAPLDVLQIHRVLFACHLIFLTTCSTAVWFAGRRRCFRISFQRRRTVMFTSERIHSK
uniref:Uncharacterized protein n=1 Tax=Cacopsylla melanoneura TaxID=428564 RepID=A0A8D8YW77_9HEMI